MLLGRVLQRDEKNNNFGKFEEHPPYEILSVPLTGVTNLISILQE